MYACRGAQTPACYIYYCLRSGWQAQFLGPDPQYPLPRTFTFAAPEKIRELARRGEALGTWSASKCRKYTIDVGRRNLLGADSIAVGQAKKKLRPDLLMVRPSRASDFSPRYNSPRDRNIKRNVFVRRRSMAPKFGNVSPR
jgi:hypothetical protein